MQKQQQGGCFMCAHMAWHVCALNVNRLFELSGNRCNLLLVQSRGLASHWCSLNVFEGARLGWRLGEFNVIYVCLWVYLFTLICLPFLQPFFVLPIHLHCFAFVFFPAAALQRIRSHSVTYGAVTSLCWCSSVRALTIVFWQSFPRCVLSLALIATSVF